jgi:hypothetical protein
MKRVDRGVRKSLLKWFLVRGHGRSQSFAVRSHRCRLPTSSSE